jgi:pSer/pThr/pTyr-binding forkhead associated (FHA) protein
MMRFRVTDAAGAREVLIRGDSAVLGRQPDCDIPLDDPGVSREHAELSCEGTAWWVKDLGSRNGTFVNDAPVGRQRIAEGDVVRLGPDVTVELLGEVDVEDTHLSSGPAQRGPQRERGSRTSGPAAAAGSPLGWFGTTNWILEPLGEREETTRLRGAATIVGRDPSAGLVLDDESVSRMHARLDREGAGLAVTDLKSRNGTHVNDETVLRASLRPGDVVRFGDVAFEVSRASGPAWGRIGALVAACAVIAVAAFTVLRVSDTLDERALIGDSARRVRTQTLEDTRAGIAASRAGDVEMARAYLLHAADLMQLSGLAPRGASLERPAEFFREVVAQLPAEEREFDFAAALDPGAIEASRARLATLTNREYVERQLSRFAVELGQDPHVPPGFTEQVWGFVTEFEKYPGSMRGMLHRARDLQPRIRGILASRHLPEAFCYVAWVESGLDPMQKSGVGALGLWQLMPSVAGEHKLRVNLANPAADDRTNIERSTAAAADYFSKLLRDQGPEYFMLVLASYNRGPNAVDRAKQKIDDPMLPAARKYWYLVEHNLLPEETRNYVPKIFAVRLIAEAPGRFGFEAQ